jgi:hypothetical protein
MFRETRFDKHWFKEYNVTLDENIQKEFVQKYVVNEWLT